MFADDKLIVPQHEKEQGAGLHDDGDVHIIVKITYRVENGELREQEYGAETVRMTEFPKKVDDLGRKLRSQVPQKSIQKARNVIHGHFRCTQSENEQLHYAGSILSTVIRISKHHVFS